MYRFKSQYTNLESRIAYEDEGICVNEAGEICRNLKILGPVPEFMLEEAEENNILAIDVIIKIQNTCKTTN